MEHQLLLHPPPKERKVLTSPEFDLDTKKNRLVPYTNNSEPTPVSEIDIEPELEAMESNTSTSTDSQSHIIIPESEMLKLSDMLKDTFRGEIVGLVNGIVEGVVSRHLIVCLQRKTICSGSVLQPKSVK